MVLGGWGGVFGEGGGREDGGLGEQEGGEYGEGRRGENLWVFVWFRFDLVRFPLLFLFLLI